ncbi:PD-(D/E)XK nuclease family protein, partial [Candidatus Woesearchaeota archaeon]
MPTYSHSRISSFENCRLQFKFHYIDKVPVEQEDTVETFLGSLVHEALEKLYKDLQFEKRLSLEDLLAWFRREWAKRWDPARIKVVRAEYSEENYRAMGERYLTDYYRRYAPFTQGRTIGLETQDFLQLDATRKYHVRIDRFVDAGEGVYEIHDYKTNTRLKTQEELEADRQLAMYALWVHENYPEARRVRLVWHFLAFDKEMVVEKELSALKALKEEVLARIDEMESATTFPPTKSALCDWCAYQALCPLWKHKFVVDALPPEEFKREDGVRLVDEYAHLKEEEKRLKERLDAVQQRLVAYGEQHGVSVVYGSSHRA